ncbi:MAG: hypothetical protein N2689_10585 [Verrucomicrobiae bacterium]|nr:hypothetical protein [Verrucomicrobiae bacterium]
MNTRMMTAVLAGLLAAGRLSSGAQQVVSPPTPGGFTTRQSGGAGLDVTTTGAPTTTRENAAQIQGLHIRIQGLLRQQKYDEAEAATMELLQRNPGDQYGMLYLRQIQAGRAALEAPLKKMIVPSVDFRQATLADVVKFLSDISAELSADKRPVSFVLQVPPDFTPAPVTLNLRQVPMLDVLRYCTSVAGLSFRIEQHAVVIYRAKPHAPPHAATTGAGAAAPIPPPTP